MLGVSMPASRMMTARIENSMWLCCLPWNRTVRREVCHPKGRKTKQATSKSTFRLQLLGKWISLARPHILAFARHEASWTRLRRRGPWHSRVVRMSEALHGSLLRRICHKHALSPGFCTAAKGTSKRMRPPGSSTPCWDGRLPEQPLLWEEALHVGRALERDVRRAAGPKTASIP